MKWPKDITEARKIQDTLKEKIKIVPLEKDPRFISGVDAAFSKDGNKVIGVACLYGYPEMILMEDSFAITNASFPYIPGFLSFREGPAIIEAIKGLKTRPDIILFDGQGIAHPKEVGIATHIGILLDIPTIGCAKSRLVGEYKESGPEKRDWCPLIYNGKTVGAALRTKDNVRAIFVSPGHRIDLDGSIEIVLNSATRYRIPEPLRRADHISKRLLLIN